MSEKEPLYQVENYSREESIGYLVKMVHARLIQALDEALTPQGITAAQWSILMLLSSEDYRTAADLCRSGICDTGAMTRMLDRLEDKGLLRRQRSQEDRRLVELKLTEDGERLPPLVLPEVVAILNHVTRDFSREELETLKSLLRRIIANAEKDSP